VALADDPVSVFHRVKQLLPFEQDLVVVSEEVTVTEALAIMAEHSFDQLPVVAGDEVLGVFSYRSFAARLSAQPKLLKRGLETLVVEDFIEELPFVRPTDSIDGLVRALGAHDAVLVGDPDDLLAVATLTDLANYLYRVSSPFVLVQEIELGIRALMSASCTPIELQECAMNALRHKYETNPSRLPTTLQAMTLDEQISIIVDGRNFARFHAAFGRHVDAIALQLRPLSDLRNTLFHFKRDLSVEELQTLVETRNWVLRRCRKYVVRAASLNGAS
jgi:CBS domain-containing protein